MAGFFDTFVENYVKPACSTVLGHPWANYWRNPKGNCQCQVCGVVADVEFTSSIANQTNKKTFLFYTFSKTETEYELSVGITGEVPTAGAKTTIKPGYPMVWIVEPHYKEDGRHTHYCIYCYEKIALKNKTEMAQLQTIIMNCKNKVALMSKGRLLSPDAYKDYR